MGLRALFDKATTSAGNVIGYTVIPALFVAMVVLGRNETPHDQQHLNDLQNRTTLKDCVAQADRQLSAAGLTWESAQIDQTNPILVQYNSCLDKRNYGREARANAPSL